MHLDPKLFLNLPANGLHNVCTKGLVDFFLVIVDSHLTGLEVLDVLELVKRVIKGHEEIVELVQFMLVLHDLREEKGIERTDPVKETAASSFFDMPLPIGNDVYFFSKYIELAEFLW